MNLVTFRRSFPLLGMVPILVLSLTLSSCAQAGEEGEAPGEEGGQEEWVSLFNGEDLSGWTIKIAGQELGVDPWETLRVEDGLLTVSYENYDGWQDRFGHIFYDEPYSHYQLRVEYRFIGDQVDGAPAWAYKNNGVMLHSQAPESMLLDQNFPLSIEAQFLGGNGTDERPTANVCTPGTHIEINGSLDETHCISASAPTIHTDEWVTVDILVLGGSYIAHIMNGDTVMAYSHPVVGGATVEEFGEAAMQDGRSLTEGYIALQSESHPIQFRQIPLKQLEKSYVGEGEG